MKRQSPPRAAASIALFPFLAVLLCTMGGLIVLLVVIARHAKQQATVDCQASIAARGELELRRSDSEWRNGHLRSSRDKTAEQLAERRAELSHLEDHMRRLRDELAELDRALADFDRHVSDKQQGTTQMRARLRELQEQIRATQEEIDQRKLARPKSESYAVVPYDGPHQTHRRPIYIECCSDAIILQPEGIELVDTDFFGPSWSGNPLAAGLRAAREYLIKNPDGGPPGSEPYPLLLVRPDGILSYYAAREAMSSWGSDFGYEFIDQDWKLEYKALDPGMMVAMARAVDDARRRQATIAMAAPRLVGARHRQNYRSASAGRSGGSARGGASGEQQPSGGGGDAAGAMPPSLVAGNSSEAQSKAADPATLYYGGSAASSGVIDGKTPAGGTQSSNNPSSNQASGNSAQKLNLQRQNDSQAAAAEGPRLKGLETPGKSFATQPRSSTTSPADMDAPPTAEEVRTPKRSIARSRGNDWSLPGNHQSAVAVTRPVLVRCYGDRLVVMHETGDKLVNEVIGLSYRTQDSIDPLVDCVHQRIDSWGIAGRGMYWRPTLVVEVAPDGRARYADLRELLTDSGLELREKELAEMPGSAPSRY
jgi:uncharacterized membrane protein YgcG